MQLSQIPIDILDHPQEPRPLVTQTEFPESSFRSFRCDKRIVGSVGCEIGKEGLTRATRFPNPIERGGEKHVCTKAARLHELAIVADNRVEVAVAGDIRTAAIESLPNSPRPVNEGFRKPALVRLVRLLISQMPFPENSSLVPGLA